MTHHRTYHVPYLPRRTRCASGGDVREKPRSTPASASTDWPGLIYSTYKCKSRLIRFVDPPPTASLPLLFSLSLSLSLSLLLFVVESPFRSLPFSLPSSSHRRTSCRILSCGFGVSPPYYCRGGSTRGRRCSHRRASPAAAAADILEVASPPQSDRRHRTKPQTRVSWTSCAYTRRRAREERKDYSLLVELLCFP